MSNPPSAAATEIKQPLQINTIEPGAIGAAFAAGWRDFVSNPAIGLVFGLLFAFGGALVVGLVFWSGYFFLAYPTAAGFTLLGPFSVIAVYEVSRQTEQGLKPKWREVISTVFRKNARRLGWMPVITLFGFILWIDVAAIIYALFFGLKVPDFWTMVREIFTTMNGFTFFAIGNLVGAVFAAVLYSISVIAYPLLADRDVDPITAIATSVRAVKSSPGAHLTYALAIVFLVSIGVATAFIGLIVVLPLLGHTTWHIYRKSVQ